MHSKNKGPVAHPHEPFCYCEHCGIRLLANMPGSRLTTREKNQTNQTVHGGQSKDPHQPWKRGGLVHHCSLALLYLLIAR